MHTVVPIAEIPGGRVQIRRLHVGVLGHFCKLIPVEDELVVVGCLTALAVSPRIENEFRVGVVREGGSELTGSVADIVVHFGQVLNEFGLGFRVSTVPIFVGLSVVVVVFTVNVVFVDEAVTVVVARIKRTGVHVVV